MTSVEIKSVINRIVKDYTNMIYFESPEIANVLVGMYYRTEYGGTVVLYTPVWVAEW